MALTLLVPCKERREMAVHVLAQLTLIVDPVLDEVNSERMEQVRQQIERASSRRRRDEMRRHSVTRNVSLCAIDRGCVAVEAISIAAHGSRERGRDDEWR